MTTLRAALPALALGTAVLVTWELYVRIAAVDALLLPPPSAVARFIAGHADLLAVESLHTVTAILLGFLAGGIFGVTTGAAMVQWAPLRRAVYPWLIVSQLVPIPAIAPILVLWFGFGIWPKLVVVAVIAFFPVAVNTYDGLRRTDREMIELLQTFGASRWQILRMVSIPAALPGVFSGLRIAMALSVVAAVFGEWVGTRHGLGRLMLTYNNQVETAGLFATVTVLAMVGVALYLAIGVIETRAMPWRRAVDGGNG